MCAPSFVDGAYFSWGCGMLIVLSAICTGASDFPSSSGSLSVENGLEKVGFDR